MRKATPVSPTSAELPRQRHAGFIRQPHKAVLDDGVAAAVFGGIERGIGGFDQVAGTMAVAGLRLADFWRLDSHTTGTQETLYFADGTGRENRMQGNDFVQSLMYTRGDIPQSTYGDNYLKLVLGEDESVLWDRSPLAHLDRLKSKLMLIVGGEDNRVPPIQGERLHAALDKAHIAHEWVYQRTEGHGFYDEGNRTELLTKIAAFLDANIGAGAR